MQGGVDRPSRRAVRGRESPKEGWEKWEALQESREGSGVSPRELEGWGGPSGEPGGVGKAWIGRESLLEDWEGLVGHPGGLGGLSRPFQRAARVREG